MTADRSQGPKDMPAGLDILFRRIDDLVVVILRYRGKGMAGDTAQLVHPGESFKGLTYDELHAARAGRILLDEAGSGQIVPGIED